MSVQAFCLLVFLLAVFFCIYTYALFPLVLHWRCSRAAGPSSALASGSNVVEKPVSSDKAGERSWPSVSIVIAAHNEIGRLETKFTSLDLIDYPSDKLRIVVVSDGSSDGTAQWLEDRPGVVSQHYEPAAGKPTALNVAVDLCTTEYLVYMDARQTVSANCVKALVSRFDDPSVGAVSGELVLSDNGQTEAANVGLYWRYEKWIRLNESRLYSTTGATGALYAIRRTDASVLPSDTLLDDFVTPIDILRRGKRTVFEPSALVFDQAEEDSAREFVRKARTLAGNFQAFSQHRWLFSPSKNPVWWQFLSHKVARLMVPYAMLIALLSSAVGVMTGTMTGAGWFLSIMFWLQVLFYAVGIAAFLAPAFAGNKLVNFIKVFLQLNAAAVIGAFRYFSGRTAVTWKGGA